MATHVVVCDRLVIRMRLRQPGPQALVSPHAAGNGPDRQLSDRLTSFSSHACGGLCERIWTATASLSCDPVTGLAVGVVVAVNEADADDARTIAREFGVSDALSLTSDNAIAPASSIECSPLAIAAALADPSGAIALDVARREISRVLLNSGCNTSQLMFTFKTESSPSEEVALQGGVLDGAVEAGCPPATAPAVADTIPTHMRVCVPETLFERIRAKVQAIADALGLDAQGCRPGLRISVAELNETDLIKHLPDPEHGGIRIHGPASLHSAAAEHPVDAKAFALQTFRHGREKSCLTGVVHESSHYPYMPIPDTESRCSSHGCFVQIGEGAAAEIAAGGCGHDLCMDSIDVVTLEDSQLPIAAGTLAGGGALLLAPLFISNPGLSSTLPAQPRGDFVSSVRAMPSASSDASEPTHLLCMVKNNVVDFSLHRIVSAKDDAPRSYADVVPQPHLSCSEEVRGMAAQVPCLPPFQGPGPHYSGKVYMNGDNERGGGSGACRLLDVVGFSEKNMRVPIPGRLYGTMPAVEITYIARPYGGTAPPAKGDSGGPVTQPGGASDAEPALLHSFVCAQVRLDPGKAHSELLYTLTPAHLVLEAVRVRQCEPRSTLPQGALRFVRPALLPV